MKKMSLLLIVLSLIFTQLSAQEKIMESPVGWRGKRIELHTISDKEKRKNAMFLINSDSIRVFFLDSTARIAREFGMEHLPGEKFMGGFIKDGMIYGFLRSVGMDTHVHSVTFDLSTGAINDYTIPINEDHERMVDRISCGDHFTCFSVNKKTSEFILYDYRDAQTCDTLRYKFEDGIWRALTKSSGLSRDMNVAKIDQEGDCSVEIAQMPNKLYLLRDTLFLLMNNKERGITYVYSFDLSHKQVGIRKIRHNDVSDLEPPLSDYTDNSILLDGKLYFVSATSDSLTVQIRDFASGELLRQYTAGREEEILFKNTPIVQEGGAYSKTSIRELGKTRQLIRKMLNGSAIIMASREDSNRVALSVGSYSKITNSGGGFGYGSMLGGGVAGMATSFTVSVGGFYRSSWTKSARFQMLLDANTMEHLDGDISMSINEKIEHYTDGMKIPEEGENLFNSNGKYIYAYYSRDEHKLIWLNL